MRALVLLALASCSSCYDVDEPLPGPTVELQVRGFDERDEQLMRGAAIEWERLGWDILPAGEPGELVVWVDAWSDLGGPCGAARRDRDQVKIDLACIERRTDWRRDPLLMTSINHELGHVLLDTPEHLPAGEIGVMAATRFSLTDGDFALACRVSGRGCR